MNQEKNVELIQHTTNWVNGEILEATIMSIVGALIIVSSLLFWKFGNTPHAKALVLPLLVVGLIPFVNGIFSVQSNRNSIPLYEQAWQQSQQQFIQSEKERVEGFDEIFKYTYPFAFIMTVGGAILFFLVASPIFKAISIAMMLLGIMAYVIDLFAAERADMYLAHINAALN